MITFFKLLKMILPGSLASRWLREPGFYGDFKTWEDAGKEIEKRTGKKPDEGLIPHSFRMPIK